MSILTKTRILMLIPAIVLSLLSAVASAQDADAPPSPTASLTGATNVDPECDWVINFDHKDPEAAGEFVPPAVGTDAQ